MKGQRETPAEQVDRLKTAATNELTDIAHRLAEARDEVAAIYTELEAAILRAEPILGATAVARIVGFKSRSSVTGIVDRHKRAGQ